MRTYLAYGSHSARDYQYAVRLTTSDNMGLSFDEAHYSHPMVSQSLQGLSFLTVVCSIISGETNI